MLPCKYPCGCIVWSSFASQCSAREYALSHGIKLTDFLPEYTKYGRSAPLKRNIAIIEYSDIVLAFWDGKSRGTKFVIDNCRKLGVEVRVYIID